MSEQTGSTFRHITMKWGNVRCQERGTGSTVLLLHSNGGNLESWALNLHELSAHFRVIALDIPGYGQSDRPPDLSRIEIISDYVASILDEIKVKKMHIVGNSLGGILGMDLAARYPDRVDRLVLAGVPSGNPDELKKLLSHLNSWLTADGTAQVDMKEAILITPKADKTILALINTNLKMAGSTFKAVNDTISLFNFDEACKKIKSKALIIWGDQDGVISINEAWSLSRFLHNARVCLIKGGGHSPQFDNAKQFNRVVLEFLSAG